MQLHELKPSSARKTEKRIGRGGKRGKMSGRGHKGQTARTGNSTRSEMLEFIKKFPKLRGHGKNRSKTVNNERIKAVPVNLTRLESIFAAGESITPKVLVAKGIISAVGGKAPVVKILATGDITKKFTIEGCQISKAAQTKIEQAGGKVTK